MLRDNNTIDMLIAFLARDSRDPCSNRTGADRVDCPADERNRVRIVSSGEPKQGGARQAAESLSPKRVSRFAKLNPAHAALCQ